MLRSAPGILIMIINLTDKQFSGDQNPPVPALRSMYRRGRRSSSFSVSVPVSLPLSEALKGLEEAPASFDFPFALVLAAASSSEELVVASESASAMQEKQAPSLRELNLRFCVRNLTHLNRSSHLLPTSCPCVCWRARSPPRSR